jgi:transcriptional regulator with XRE-family HTH domain
MSLRDFAGYLGISHAYLSKLEKGLDEKTGKEISPTIDTLLKLASSLNIDAQSFFEACGYLGSKPAKAPPNVDISKYIDTLIAQTAKADNIIVNNSPISSADKKTLYTALEIALQIVIKDNNK